MNKTPSNKTIRTQMLMQMEERKGTIIQIQEYTKKYFGYKAKSCWIAHVKELCGVNVKQAWNRKFSGSRQVPCPDGKVEQIKKALKYYNWIE